MTKKAVSATKVTVVPTTKAVLCNVIRMALTIPTLPIPISARMIVRLAGRKSPLPNPATTELSMIHQGASSAATVDSRQTNPSVVIPAAADVMVPGRYRRAPGPARTEPNRTENHRRGQREETEPGLERRHPPQDLEIERQRHTSPAEETSLTNPDRFARRNILSANIAISTIGSLMRRSYHTNNGMHTAHRAALPTTRGCDQPRSIPLGRCTTMG